MELSLDSKSEHISTSHKSREAPKDRLVRRAISYSPAQSKPVSLTIPKRRVKFSQDVNTWNVSRRCDMTDEEFASIWYGKDDFKNIKKMFIPTLKKMAKNVPLGCEEEPRGLEHKTPQGNRRRQQNRLIAVDAVLREQESQWERNRIDPEYIAELYRQSTAHCVMQAFLNAKNDEVFVNKHVREIFGSSNKQEGADEWSSTVDEEEDISSSSSFEANSPSPRGPSPTCKVMDAMRSKCVLIPAA